MLQQRLHVRQPLSVMQPVGLLANAVSTVVLCIDVVVIAALPSAVCFAFLAKGFVVDNEPIARIICFATILALSTFSGVVESVV